MNHNKQMKNAYTDKPNRIRTPKINTSVHYSYKHLYTT